MLSVVNGPANQKVNAILKEDGDFFSKTIYGDFTVEPVEPDEKGHMRHAKILSVKDVVVERDVDRKILAKKKEL